MTKEIEALTPRHEAPAALCDHGHTDPMALCSDCEAASVEAPAEGAGEAVACPHCGGPAKVMTCMGEWVGKGKGEHGGYYGPERWTVVCNSLYEEPIRDCPERNISETREQAVAKWNGSNLRARSSAPEALGNLLAVIHRDGGHRTLEVGVEQAAAEAEKIVAGLMAAPSADKLRIAVEALEVAKRLAMTHAPLSAAPKIIKALAALKAEV